MWQNNGWTGTGTTYQYQPDNSILMIECPRCHVWSTTKCECKEKNENNEQVGVERQNKDIIH